MFIWQKVRRLVSWSRRRVNRRRPAAASLRLEALEDRTLLSVVAHISGSTLLVSVSAGDTSAHSVKLEQNPNHPVKQTDVLSSGKVIGTFKNANFNLINVILGAGNATLNLANVKIPTNGITIDEGSGNNTLIDPAKGVTWTITGTNAGTIGDAITFQDVENLVGGAHSTLIGPNTATSWTLTGSDAGTVGGMAFKKFTNLVGGNATNTFAFQANGSIDGTIDGGSSAGNTLDYSAYGTTVRVDLRKQAAAASDGYSGTATATGGFSEIQNLVGSGAVNKLIGSNLNTVWTLTGTNQGSLSGAGTSANYNLTFQGFANLTGGKAHNTFQFVGDALVTGSIDGGPGGKNTLDYSQANYPTTNAINFTDFSSTTNLSLNGAVTTSTTDGNVLRLVTAQGNESHSAFDDQMVSDSSFSTTFQFRLTDPGGVKDPNGHVGADGFVFVLQGDSPATSGGGGAGGNLGLDPRFPDSLGIAFDTWENTGHHDSSSNELGIDLYGSVDHGSHNGATVNVTPAFDNGDLWQAWVAYDGTTLSIYVSDVTVNGPGQPANPTLVQQLNVPLVVGSPFAFAGFTGATGAGWQNEDFLNWQYNSTTSLPNNPGVLVDGDPLLGPNSATGIGAGFSDIQHVAGSAGVNYLRSDGNWKITGANAGIAPGGLAFSSFQNLEGADSASNFIFSANASLAGSIFTSYPTYGPTTTVALAAGATVGGFIQGGPGQNTLIGPGGGSTFDLTGTDAGTVNDISFSGFRNLVGGNGSNTFAFQAGAGIKGTIDGGTSGDNWLDYSAYGAAVTVNLATRTATGVDGGGVKHIQNVIGSNAGNKLVGDAHGNILIGGSGNDTIIGGSGRSILIGNGGSDSIAGGANEDILIAGSVNFGTNLEAALSTILSELQRTDETFAQRVSNIRAGVGPNNAYQLVLGTTVLDDGDTDTLRGNPAGSEGAADWFFANLATGHDKIVDLTNVDVVN